MQYPQKQKSASRAIDFLIEFIYNFINYYAIVYFYAFSGGNKQ